ncbi:MAG: hypothetical protein GXO88_01140 [Chlorobi bacterium]|nr:hypothetical protein [Chlorobiota bacterium]
MKTPMFTLLAIFLLAASACAQDFIYLKNGDRLEAVITETTKTSIIYVDYGSSTNDVKIVDKNDIKMIAYSNGEIDEYGFDNKAGQKGDFNKNLFAYHLADLLINNLTISYERILDNGKIGVQIPISIGYRGNYQELGDFQNKFYTGINLNFYPTGQGMWRFFLGPGLRVGSGHIEDYYYDYGNGNNYYYNKDVFYFKFHINNGIMFSPIPELSLVASLSLGIRYVDENIYDYKVRTTGAASFNMIYRF